MTWKQLLTSSVGKKITMSLTGIFLILFLIIHAGLNACIWASLVNPEDHGEMFNKAAHFMGSMVVIRILEIGLFAFIILHIIQGIMLELDNRSKRGSVAYAVKYGNRGSKWYSRSMGLLGTLLLLFLIMHIYHFWAPSRLGGIAGVKELEPVVYPGMSEVYHNLYAEMVHVFQNPVVVVLYVLGCISLAYHLAHGFQSAFRTLGVHNKRYSVIITNVGYAYSIFIPLVFALMPVSMYMGWVS